MVKTLRSVGAASCAKVFALLYGMLGVLIGAMFSIFALVGAELGAFGRIGPFGRILFGFGSIIFFPVLYSVIGAIGGLIFGGLYNVVANLVGGIELDIGD